MRKIIPYVMKLSLVLMALSVIGQQVTATRGDVQRALDLLKQARAAIGGESAINSIQSLSINGRSQRQVQLPDQASRELTGEFELSMLLPDKLIRMEKLMVGGSPNERASGTEQKHKVRDVRVKVLGGPEHAEMQERVRNREHAELARYMLGLLLTPPPSLNATYNYAGEGEVNGARCDIIEASGAGGFALKLYLDKSSHLPLMMSYQGMIPRIRLNAPVGPDGHMIGEETDVVVRRAPKGESGETSPGIIIERRRASGETLSAEESKSLVTLPPPERAEIQVLFSDFRSVGGVLLPHAITEMINGKSETVWTVERYEINSPSNNDKFQKNMQFRVKRNEIN